MKSASGDIAGQEKNACSILVAYSHKNVIFNCHCFQAMLATSLSDVEGLQVLEHADIVRLAGQTTATPSK